MLEVCSKRVIIPLSIVLCAVGIVFGQSDYGSISGFAKDQSGAVVPKAKVTIRNEGTREERTTSTNDSGYYVVTNLAPSLYTVEVEASGFKKFATPHAKLDANSTLAVDANLVVGAATESIEVAAQATVLQTESGAVQNEVTGQQIQDQELNGRNPALHGAVSAGDAERLDPGRFQFRGGRGPAV